MRVPDGEYISKEAASLEMQVKEKYGKKRGSAMIQDARQCAEYGFDSSEFSQMEYLKKFIANLKGKL